MNYTFRLEQIAKTADLNVDLILSQYTLHKMAQFLEIKSINAKLKQSEVDRELKISTSTLKRYRREMNMRSHYRITP